MTKLLAWSSKVRPRIGSGCSGRRPRLPKDVTVKRDARMTLRWDTKVGDAFCQTRSSAARPQDAPLSIKGL